MSLASHNTKIAAQAALQAACVFQHDGDVSDGHRYLHGMDFISADP